MARVRDILAALRAVEKLEKKLNDMNKKYPLKYKEELERIGDHVITDWYSTYEPIFYNRRGSLYNAFRVNLNGTDYSVEFDYNLLGGDKVNELIFENSFIRGYHGGAADGVGHPNPGVPYWRTPYPLLTNWGRPALRSFSPYTRIVSEMNKKIREIDGDKQDEFNKAVNKVYKIINRFA